MVHPCGLLELLRTVDENIDQHLTSLNRQILLTYITTVGNYVGLKIPLSVAAGTQQISAEKILQDGHSSQASSPPDVSVPGGSTFGDTVSPIETPSSFVVAPASLHNEDKMDDQAAVQKDSTQIPTPESSPTPSHQPDLQVGKVHLPDFTDQYARALNMLPGNGPLSDRIPQDQISRAGQGQLQNDFLPPNLAAQITTDQSDLKRIGNVQRRQQRKTNSSKREFSGYRELKYVILYIKFLDSGADYLSRHINKNNRTGRPPGRHHRIGERTKESPSINAIGMAGSFSTSSLQHSNDPDYWPAENQYGSPIHQPGENFDLSRPQTCSPQARNSFHNQGPGFLPFSPQMNSQSPTDYHPLQSQSPSQSPNDHDLVESSQPFPYLDENFNNFQGHPPHPPGFQSPSPHWRERPRHHSWPQTRHPQDSNVMFQTSTRHAQSSNFIHSAVQAPDTQSAVQHLELPQYDLDVDPLLPQYDEDEIFIGNLVLQAGNCLGYRSLCTPGSECQQGCSCPTLEARAKQLTQSQGMRSGSSNPPKRRKTNSPRQIPQALHNEIDLFLNNPVQNIQVATESSQDYNLPFPIASDVMGFNATTFDNQTPPEPPVSSGSYGNGPALAINHFDDVPGENFKIDLHKGAIHSEMIFEFGEDLDSGLGFTEPGSRVDWDFHMDWAASPNGLGFGQRI